VISEDTLERRGSADQHFVTEDDDGYNYQDDGEQRDSSRESSSHHAPRE